jgi:hypothetical protein
MALHRELEGSGFRVQGPPFGVYRSRFKDQDSHPPVLS